MLIMHLNQNLSEELKIRNNGYIALSVGEGDDKQSKTINVGEASSIQPREN